MMCVVDDYGKFGIVIESFNDGVKDRNVPMETEGETEYYLVACLFGLECELDRLAESLDGCDIVSHVNQDHWRGWIVGSRHRDCRLDYFLTRQILFPACWHTRDQRQRQLSFPQTLQSNRRSSSESQQFICASLVRMYLHYICLQTDAHLLSCLYDFLHALVCTQIYVCMSVNVGGCQ